MGGTGAAGPQQAGRPRPPKAPGWESVRGDERGTRADQVRQAVATVRLEVFVQEQQVPLSLEMDARDDQPTTIHLLVRGQGGEPLGAARLLLEPEHPGQVHLGRLAVRRHARGTGLGARLVTAVEQEALARATARLGPQAAAWGGVPAGTYGVVVLLSAQEQALGFYERCGYRTVSGRRYLDAGIWHQDMARLLCPA